VLWHAGGKQLFPELRFYDGARFLCGLGPSGGLGFPGRLGGREIVHHGN
jgi:hypothetical protein